jgi:hypothetical protein
MDKQVDGVEARRLLDRADFLKLAGAAGIGAAAGTSLLPGAAGAEVRTKLDPTDFSFSIRERFRPFNLLAENFIQLDDDFERDSILDYTPLAPDNTGYGRYEVENGRLRFSGDDYYTVLKSDTGQEAPYASVIVDVSSLPGGTIYAGLYRDNDNYIHAFYNKDTNTVGLEAEVAGQYFEIGTTQPDEQGLFEAPFRFAFVVNENRVVALVSDRSSDIGNFRPIIERDVFFETGEALDMRRKDVLATYKNGFGAESDDGDTIAFERVRAGYYGEAGVRDPHVVQYADGAPYIKNGKLYFTLTNAGLGFFEKAHWGVWTIDLSDYTNIEQVGNIFWTNAGQPNIVLGHHAGQIVRDEENDRWIVLASSWGDFGPQGGDLALEPGVETPNPANPPVDILFDEEPLTTNLLEGVHELVGARHPVNDIPFRTEGKWDPSLTRIDGVWHLAYVIAMDLFTRFIPALATSEVDHDEGLTFVGADWERHQAPEPGVPNRRATEGPIIQKLGGEWRLFASHGDDEPDPYENKYPIYFLRAENPGAAPADRQLDFDGYLDAPHPTNIPHPQIVPIPFRSNGRTRTKYILITFNGTQYYEPVLGYGTHGDFIVMQAKQTVRGREFPRR